MISKKRFLFKRIIDDTLGKVVFNLLKIRKKRELPKKVNKIVILKLSSIGDSLLSLPGIKYLKEFTNAKIVVVHSKDNECIFKNQKFIDETFLLDVSGDNPLNLIKALLKLKDQKAEVSMDLSHTGNLSALFSAFSGKFLIGFFNEEFPSRKGLYDLEISLNKNKHMVLNYFNLTNSLYKNKNIQAISLVRPLDEKTQKHKIEKLLNSKKNLVGIHSCHEIKEKSWAKENFSKLIDYLVERGKTPVLIGSLKEKEEVGKLVSLLKHKNKVLDLSGELNIPEVFTIMNYFDFFISNDGGIMHIAASFNLPTLGIFSAETPKKYAPFNAKSFAIDSRKISKEESFKTAKKVIDLFLNKHL